MKMTTGVMVKAVIICMLLGSLSGCSSVSHLTVASNKVFRLSDFELEKADRKKDVEGTSIQHILLFIPLSAPPTIEDAMDDAMQKGGGDVMTDVEMKFWTFYIPYLYGQTGWSVKGDVVKTRKN